MEDARDNIAVEALDIAIKEIERPRGEWKSVTKNNSFDLEVTCYECSVCKKSSIPQMHILIFEKLDFCPNCGASMRKEGAEE